MKTILLNGSPRKNWNTALMLKAAQKGAESVGAETEYIDLFDLSYTGCRSCLACKRKDAERCKCFWKDDLYYSKYSMAGFNEEHKKEMREKQFPQDLEEAFQMGASLGGGR